MVRVSPMVSSTLSTIPEEPDTRTSYIGSEGSMPSITVVNIEIPYMAAVITERTLTKRKTSPFSRKASKREVLRELNNNLRISRVNIHRSPSSKITKKEIEQLTEEIFVIVRRCLVPSMSLPEELEILMNVVSTRYSWRPDWLGRQPTYKNMQAETFEKAMKSIIEYHLQHNFSIFKGIRYCLSQKDGKGPLNNLVQELDMRFIRAAFPGDFSIEVKPKKNRSFEIISEIDGIRSSIKTINL